MPATYEKIGEILQSDAFDESDKWVVKWQFGLLGDFETALAKTIAAADEHNQARLRLGFPVQVEGFYRWAYRGLADRLRAAGLDI